MYEFFFRYLDEPCVPRQVFGPVTRDYRGLQDNCKIGELRRQGFIERGGQTGRFARILTVFIILTCNGVPPPIEKTRRLGSI